MKCLTTRNNFWLEMTTTKTQQLKAFQQQAPGNIRYPTKIQGGDLGTRL